MRNLHPVHSPGRATTTTLALATVLALPSCSDDGARPPSATLLVVADPASISHELAAAVADGNVSFEEYEAGFLRFQGCVSTSGFPMTDVEFDPTRQMYSYLVPNEDDHGGAVDSCYERQFGEVDANWQVSAARPRPGYENMSMSEILVECLDHAGAGGPDLAGLDLTDLERVAEQHQLGIEVCYQRAQLLHP